ncbi:hypothetical protein OG749_21335 [Streptomyces nojiriensis]|uniref:hypothetical protein n=1 Tax=Streptomyces nojiriensis TaxID=66374 RepID=UPI002E176820
MQTIWLSGAEWLAVLRTGLGLWWLESWRHKDKKGWFERGTGIAWAADVAGRHRWTFVKGGFEIHDRAGQEQNAMTALISLVALLGAIGLFL